MTHNSRLFKELDTSINVSIRMGNGAIVKSVGRGTISIPTKKGMKLISDMLLVLELDQNLLSVSQMVSHGYSLVFENNHCTIFDPARKEIANVAMENKSFSFMWQHSRDVLKAKVDETWLWHKRYGHYHLNALKYLHDKQILRNLPPIQVYDDVCDACLLGELHRQHFPIEKAWRAREKLELVHTDLCSPMRTLFLSENKYFILFIDDFTRMTWVYFLRQKSNVLHVFKKFKSLVETESGCKIKHLRSNWGKEYTSVEFE